MEKGQPLDLKRVTTKSGQRSGTKRKEIKMATETKTQTIILCDICNEQIKDKGWHVRPLIAPEEYSKFPHQNLDAQPGQDLCPTCVFDVVGTNPSTSEEAVPHWMEKLAKEFDWLDLLKEGEKISGRTTEEWREVLAEFGRKIEKGLKG